MNYKDFIKSVFVKTPLFFPVSYKFTRNNNPIVFVYHRFCDSKETSEHKVDNLTFEWQVQQLVKNYNILTLGEYIELVSHGERVPERTVILTIDDGYLDFYTFAYPVLKKYGVKATFFVTVNFVENKIWLWPDLIEYLVKQTKQEILEIDLGEERVKFFLHDKNDKTKCFREIINFCTQIEDRKKWEIITRLEEVINVKLPGEIPSEFQPVNWDQLIEMSENGIEIGSHTMNHPILSKIPKNNLYDEINSSKKELEKHLGREIISFCYPNSGPGDINNSVITQLKDANYKGAVFGGYPHKGDLYKIPRIGADRNKPGFLWKLSGMEFLRK